MTVLEVQIHGIDWEVQIFDEEDDEVVVNGVGMCDYCKYTIQVAAGLKKSQLRTVLLHEVTHAFRWTYGLVSELPKITIPTTEIEEMIANSVEVFGPEIIACVDEIMSNLED